MQLTYLKLLEIDATATQEDIKLAYRKLAKKYHPDMGGSKDMFLMLQNAYDWLMKHHTPIKPPILKKDTREYDRIFRIFEKPPPWNVVIPSQYVILDKGLVLVCMYADREFRVPFEAGTKFPKTISISNVYGKSAMMNITLGNGS